jgi:hypothetical protein
MRITDSEHDEAIEEIRKIMVHYGYQNRDMADEILSKVSTILLRNRPATVEQQPNVNAERYQYLREQYWLESDMFVVVGGKNNVQLGTLCPSKERLDQLVDERRAMKGKS